MCLCVYAHNLIDRIKLHRWQLSVKVTISRSRERMREMIYIFKVFAYVS